MSAASRPIPEVLAKRWLSENQTTQSASGVGVMAGGGWMHAAGVAVSEESSAIHAAVSVGSAETSENTAPASTAESWSLSPSRIRRASGGTASHSRQASARSSIDASSTTSASIGSGFSAWWRKRPGSGVTPSSRCSVCDSRGSRACSSTGRSPARWRSASSMRAAALPVGAARATRRPGFSVSRQARRATTVVVLPVPGPPLMIVSLLRQASAAASFCQSGRSPSRRALSANRQSSCWRISAVGGDVWRSARLRRLAASRRS